MKRNLIYYAIVFSMVLFGFGLSSCSKDEGPSGELRKVRYEAVGNIGVSTEFQFTPTMEKPGPMDFEYNEYTEVSTLPWQKEVFHHPSQEGGFSTSVKDAIPGSHITFRIYVNDELLGEHTAVVGPKGDVHLFMNYFKDGTVQKGGPTYR